MSSTPAPARQDQEQDMLTADAAPSELAIVVDELLNQLSSKFSNISQELISKMDEMSRRLDGLEATIQASGSARSENEGGEGSSAQA
ncbi:hypothetical protein B0A49_04459 [Cryomyces minteri]|uniref:Heat shock factor-binding protein 1 n=1 Tax=Cryomyces minteri TaxID=331657 RepID=A0A4U0XA68_9PEZI|nr:hypothetical protein B0A49_04459 [Cryomyces minteri]